MPVVVLSFELKIIYVDASSTAPITAPKTLLSTLDHPPGIRELATDVSSVIALTAPVTLLVNKATPALLRESFKISVPFFLFSSGNNKLSRVSVTAVPTHEPKLPPMAVPTGPPTAVPANCIPPLTAPPIAPLT